METCTVHRLRKKESTEMCQEYFEIMEGNKYRVDVRRIKVYKVVEVNESSNGAVTYHSPILVGNRFYQKTIGSRGTIMEYSIRGFHHSDFETTEGMYVYVNSDDAHRFADLLSNNSGEKFAVLQCTLPVGSHMIFGFDADCAIILRVDRLYCSGVHKP